MRPIPSIIRRRSLIVALLCMLGVTRRNDYQVYARKRSRHVVMRQFRSKPQHDSPAEFRRPTRNHRRLEATMSSCEPASVCEICTGAQRLELEECKATGRRQRYDCDSSTTLEDSNTESIYKSCRRTESDEEFLMIRLQMICFTLGTLSLLSVRKQKVVSASLFDQRKAGRRTSATSGMDEPHGTLETETELVPLTANPIDVV